MSSEAVATAAREHAQAEEAAGPNSRAGTESSNPAAPFAAGVRHVAAVRPTEMVALQRLAGNAAVSRLVARRLGAQRAASIQRTAEGDVSVQRGGPDEGEQRAVQAADPWTDIVAVGDDPMAKIQKGAAALFKVTDNLELGGKEAAVFHPDRLAIMYMDFIVIVGRTGPLDVRPQSDPPVTAPKSVVVIVDPKTLSLWKLQLNTTTGQARAHHDRTLMFFGAGGVQANTIGMYFFLGKNDFLGADLAADVRKMIPSAKDAKSGKPAGNPDWAKSQADKLRKRRGKGGGTKGPGGVEGGQGLGMQGTGTGGGGTKDDPKAVPGGDGQEKKERGQGGPPKDPKDPKAPGDPKKPGASASATPPKNADAAPGEKKIGGTVPGDPNAPKPKPLQGDPKFQVITTEDGKTHLQITIDRASTWVDMVEGEKDTSLDARIDKAIEKLQDSRDPEKHGMVANPVKESGFKPEKGATGTAGTGADAAKQATGTATNATPGERIPGAKGGANAPAYPARITMGGNNEPAPTSVSGATNHFTMEIDYAAMSFGMRDEVFNRMQTISFYWELLDVTGKTLAEKTEVEKKTKVGGGQAAGPGSGAGRNLGRALDNVAEDQRADLEMMEKEDWGWDARAAYLTLIGVSNAVRTVGALISSYVDLVTEPLNERSIGLRNTGEYLVRCVATPTVSDAARADPDKHVIRASSIAALPIKVVDINTRAKGSLNEEGSQLAKLEKAVADAKNDDERKEAQTMLDAAKKSSALGGLQTFQSSVSGLRHRLEVARKLKATYAKGIKARDMEGEQAALAYALEERNGDVDQLIKQLEGQLKTLAGDDSEKGQGEHEAWVAKQSWTFKGSTEYRPRVVLASEESGQVTPVLMMLGESTKSTTERPRWRLIDISSPSGREIYEGKSDTAGPAGHALAIRDAFRDFAENNDYGRGSIAIRLPTQLTSRPEYAGATVDPLMRSAKGGSGRLKQRLQDLATAAEVVGLFVTGPIGVAVAAVGGIAGAIIAVDSLAKRVRTGHVVEVGTIFDILGVIGGVTSAAGVGVAMANARLGKIAATGGKMPSWVGKLEKTERALHIHGVIGNVQQVIVIPMDLIKELDSIGGANDGETNARRALALLRAFKSGTVTVIGIAGGIPMGKEKAGGKGAGEHEPSAPKQLPAGHNANAADALAAASGPAKPPTQAPHVEGVPTAKPAAPSGEPGPAKGGEQASREGAPKGDEVRTPSPDAVLAHALDLARQRAKASEEVVGGGGTGPKPAGTGEAAADGPAGAKPAESGDPGAAKPTAPGGSSGPKPIDPKKPIETNLANVADAGPGASRTDALIGIVAKGGPKPDGEARGIRKDASKNKAAADQDAVGAVKDSGEFGQLRRDVDSMSNLNDAQRSALTSRLQEARLAVTNEHVGKVLGELQKQFPDLEFHVQDLGTVGFNSDRDITIRVTAKDPAAYAKLGESERAHMDRRMVQASSEAVPKLYEALDAAGYPANKSLDTNFYTELHEGRVKPADAAEARSIVADQQIVSLTEIILNTSPDQWKAFVEQQKGMIEGLRGKGGTPEKEIAGLRKRLDAQVAEAEAHSKRLVGDSHGHPTPDARNAALKKAREDLVAATKKEPPPTARELRQLMADVKLLEPDAYGTRAAVESVVYGGQTLKGASMEKVQGDGFRTRKQIEHNEGEPGPKRLDPESGELREVSAEDEVGRRRAEGQAHVGARRPGDTGANSYEQDVGRLKVAQAVQAHLDGHLPGPGQGVPTDASAAAKNLGRIVEIVGEVQIRSRSEGISYLPAIVAAKGGADPSAAIHKELGKWARESGVRGWAESNKLPLGTDAQRLDAFVAWSKEQAANLTGRMRIRAEMGALYGDAPVGTGRSPKAGPVAPAGPDQGTPPPAGGSGLAKPLPSGEAPVGADESQSTPALSHDKPGTAANPTGDDDGHPASPNKADAAAKVDETHALAGPKPTTTDAPAADSGGAGKPPKGPDGPLAGDDGPTPTPKGTGGGGGKGPAKTLEQTQAEAETQISHLRNRLYSWRQGTDDPVSLHQIQEHLRELIELRKANKKGTPVGDRLAAIKASLPHEQAKTEAKAEIERLRSRLYSWRASTDDPTALVHIEDYLRQLNKLAKENRKGMAVEGALKGIREDLPNERKNLRPVSNDQIEALRTRVEKLRAKTKKAESKEAYDNILKDVDALRKRTQADKGADPRTSYDAIRKSIKKAGKEDYDVHVPLDDPAVRAEMHDFFSDRLADLPENAVSRVLQEKILSHIDTADELVLAQSPRSAGVGAAATRPMQKEVLAAIKAGKYPEGYKLAFEAAAGGKEGVWPKDEYGASWQVDHVAELWLGGEDNVTNYLALPLELHAAKTEILTDFREKYRDTRKVADEQVDHRSH